MILAPPPVQIDVLHAFRAQLPRIHQVSKAPVLLPRKLRLSGRFRVYATGGASARSWDLELAAAPNCGGANACFVASFDARRGGKLPRPANLRLATGERAVYQPVTCGASCAPATLSFVRRRILYTWQFKGVSNSKGVMARLASEAIKAGGR
jgi:hypothetical protein